MKKTILFLFIFSVLYSAFASASNMSVSVLGDSFFAGQTVQAIVAMDRFEISKLALKDDAGNKVLVGFFRYAYGDGSYMAYFNLPPTMQPGNYTFSASDRIMENSVLKDINASSRFKVSFGDSVFSVSPAIIKLASSQSVFRVDLRHTYGTGTDISISVTDSGLKPVRASMSMAPGEAKTLYVNYDYSKIKEDAVLKLSAGALSYEIPIISGKAALNISNASEPASNQSGLQNATGIGTALETVGKISVIRHKVARDRTIAGSLKIRNAYSQPLHNLTFASAGVPGLELNVTGLPLLGPGEIYAQYIWINRLKNAEPGNYTGTITITSIEGASLAIRLETEFQDIPQAENEAPVIENQAALMPNQTSPPFTPVADSGNTQINLTFNFSEIQKASEEGKQRSLWIAVMLILIVLLIIALLVYKLRPKIQYKHMKEYTQELERGPKKQ